MASHLKRIEIVSDVICPWCWVGKKNLEKAIGMKGLEDYEIVWRPFQLRPHMPVEGVKKSPDTPDNPRVSPRLYAAGKTAGIEFTGKCDTTPNTLMAHTLLKYALVEQQSGNKSVQNNLSEVLFRMYFTDGVFLDHDNLLLAAKEAGLDVEKAGAYMKDASKQQEVSHEALENARRGVSGVPTFFIDGKELFSGAVPPNNFLPYL